MIAHHRGMSDYRRVHCPGGTFFFTVNLADRGSHLLVERIDDLRVAYASVAAEHPFRTEAIVVMPDHLHAVQVLQSVLLIFWSAEFIPQLRGRWSPS